MKATLDVPTAPERRGAARALREIQDHLAQARVVELYGAEGSLGAALAAGLAPTRAAGPVIYICADEDVAEARLDDLTFFLPPPEASDDPLAPPAALQLPAPDASPYAEMQPDRRAHLARMAALFRLARGFAPRVLVASALALARRVVPRAPFEDLCWTIRARATLDRERTIAAFASAGFSRASVVEDPGTFAVRGAVIDVFPPVYRHPVRIELFGDEVESLRLYDAATQRTLRPLSELHLHPVRDTIRTAGADPRAKILAAADAALYPSSKTRHLLEQIEAGEAFFGMEALAPAFHAHLGTVFDYLPADALLVVEDPEAVVESARRHASKLRETAGARRAEHRLALDAAEFVLLEDETRAALAARPRVELHPIEVTHFGPNDGLPPRVRLEAEPNTTLRAELHRARAEGSERAHAASPEAAALDLGKPLRDPAAGVDRRRRARAARRAQPRPRRAPRGPPHGLGPRAAHARRRARRRAARGR